MFGKNSGGAAWLLVCLGNPGDKYENTRHNVGFMVADEIGERQNAPIQKLKFKALTNLFTISGQKVLVMKPTSSPGCGWALGRSPTPTMTWPTGCWASSWARTKRPWTPQ